MDKQLQDTLASSVIQMLWSLDGCARWRKVTIAVPIKIKWRRKVFAECGKWVGGLGKCSWSAARRICMILIRHPSPHQADSRPENLEPIDAGRTSRTVQDSYYGYWQFVAASDPSRQCFGSGFRGLLIRIRIQRLKKESKMLNKHNIILLFSDLCTQFYLSIDFFWSANLICNNEVI